MFGSASDYFDKKLLLLIKAKIGSLSAGDPRAWLADEATEKVLYSFTRH
jgi:hypothetical protein